jgi:hypothetical protein
MGCKANKRTKKGGDMLSLLASFFGIDLGGEGVHSDALMAYG